MNAHSPNSAQASHSGVPITPLATNSPATNSNESPGRKKPMSRPHSAKMIRQTPITANGPRVPRMFSGSSQGGSSARDDVVASASASDAEVTGLHSTGAGSTGDAGR